MYNTEESQLTSLTISDSGKIITGTDSGLVIRHDTWHNDVTEFVIIEICHFKMWLDLQKGVSCSHSIL